MHVEKALGNLEAKIVEHEIDKSAYCTCNGTKRIFDRFDSSQPIWQRYIHQQFLF